MPEATALASSVLRGSLVLDVGWGLAASYIGGSMPVNRFSIFLIYAWMALPVLLFGLAGVYFVVRKRWIASPAAVILALDWLYMGAVNSVV